MRRLQMFITADLIETVRALGASSDRRGSLGGVIRDFLPTPEWAETLRTLESLHRGTSPGERLYDLAADGIRLRLHHAGLVDPDPLALKPAALHEVHAQFLEAAAVRAGTYAGELEPQWVLAELPRGGEWERQGLAGKLALIGRRETVTADGIVRRPRGDADA